MGAKIVGVEPREIKDALQPGGKGYYLIVKTENSTNDIEIDRDGDVFVNGRPASSDIIASEAVTAMESMGYRYKNGRWEKELTDKDLIIKGLGVPPSVIEQEMRKPDQGQK